MTNNVTIQNYNPNWIIQFNEEKKQLSTLLSEFILAIEHIGSTAVEGLSAKPIIDIMIGVSDLECVTEFIKPLKQVGYEFVNHENFPERRFFRKGEWRAGTHHLHVYQYGGKHWRDQILFRDELRKNHTLRKEYQHLKLELAKKHSQNVVAYTKNKAPFIQGFLENS
ncbi:GrpB family protein [Metabacillus sp. HB246100]